MRKLQEDFEMEAAKLREAIDVAAAVDPVAAAAARATPLQEVEVEQQVSDVAAAPVAVHTHVVIGGQVNAATLWADMSVSPGLGVQSEEQAHALLTFFLRHWQQR